MKILVCTDSFFPGVGGTEVAVNQYVQELSKNHEVLLVCPSYGNKKRNADEKYGFNILRLPSLKVSSNDRAALPAISFKQKRKIKAFQPDIIHIESVSGLAKLGLKMGKKLNVPVVMTIHTKFKQAFSNSIKSKFIVNCYIKNVLNKLNRADAIITVADCMVDDMASWGKINKQDQIKVIKNGATLPKHDISKEEKNNIRERLGFKKEDNLLLFVGRLTRVKNLEFILNALKIACEKGFDGKLLFVGTGLDVTYYKNLVKSLNLEDKVVFVGQVTDKQLITDYYSIADLFVMASIFDNDPLVVIEAACCKVPSLVLEKTGCSNRIVDNENGFTVAHKEESFADRLIEVFADKEKLAQIGEKAFDTIPTTWQKTVEENMEVYNQLLQKK